MPCSSCTCAQAVSCVLIRRHLQGMAGSLQRTNPGLTLLILVVSKELPPAVEAQAGALGTLLPVQDVALASRNEFEDSRWVALLQLAASCGRC